MSEEIPFERTKHLLTIAVTLSGSVRTRFVLDTGMGVNLISNSLRDRVGLVATSEVLQERLWSGQRLETPIEVIPSLGIGQKEWTDLKVISIDTSGFDPALGNVGGFLSIGPFSCLAFTIDHDRHILRLHEDGDHGFRDALGYEEVDLHLRQERTSLTPEVDLALPDGNNARVILDTGSDSLLLNVRYMAPLGVNPSDEGVRTVESRDDWGFSYRRHFASVDGAFRILGTSRIREIIAPVAFQQIESEGLLGSSFLSRYNVTCDLPRSRVGFAPCPRLPHARLAVK